MSEPNNDNIVQEMVNKYKKQQFRQMAIHAARFVAVAIWNAIMAVLTFLFATPVGWVILIIAVILFLGMADYNGETAAQASENHRAVYATDESDKAYHDLEATTYTAQSDSDNSYLDEYEFRLSWAVMEEMDTYLYKGQATTAQRQEIIDSLKSTYSGDRPDHDTYITYKAKAVYRTESYTNADGTTGSRQVFDHWEWEKASEKQVKRHIIPQAVTWMGTFTRDYGEAPVHRDDRIKKPQPTSADDTAEETYIWQFETTGQTIDYATLKNYIKKNNPQVWDSQINMIIGVIDLLLGQYDFYDTGLDNGQTDFTNNGILAVGDFTWPTTSTNITCPYGPRIHPITHKPSFHYGIDIGAKTPGVIGDIIVAAKDGIVAYEGHMDQIEGNYIKIDHGTDSQGRRVFTRYLHLSKFLVNEGDTVKAGQPIGLMGSTGWSTGPHLHFEIIINGQPVDPMQFFRTVGGKVVPPTGDEMDLFIRVVNAEAGGEGDAGITGVAEVVRNRMTSRAWAYKHYQNVTEVLTDGNGTQFNGYWHINNPIPQAQYDRIKYLINKVMNEHTNTVNDATFFTGPPVNPDNFASQNRCTIFKQIASTVFYIANADQ